jgi:hypothetical protein
MNKLALIVALTLALSAAATAQTTDKSGKVPATGPTTLGGGVTATTTLSGPTTPDGGVSAERPSSSSPTGTAVR